MQRCFVTLVVLLFGCGGDMGEQTLQVQARGLWLTANPLDAPPGALSTADNAVIRRPGIVEPRRGQKPDTDVVTAVQSRSQMASFEDQIFAHLATGDIITRTGVGTFTTLGSGFTAPSGYPLRFAEAGGGLYFTTDVGPYRIDSPTSAPVVAGTPPGLEGSGTTTGASGWLATGRVVGYRFLWGSRDGDGALLLGAPSGRILVDNSSGGSRDISLTTPIPDGIVAGTHFLQVYRTVIDAASGDDPGEDMAQVLEVFPTATELAAGTMTVTDIASFANGATAYFSPTSGAGIADSKQQPPLLTDAISFKGYLFGVVQEYRQTLNLTLLAVGTSPGLLMGNGLKFYDGTTTETYTAGAAEAFPDVFLLDTAGTAAQNIENTARSLVRAINSRTGGLLYASYVSSTSGLPGQVLITSRAVGGAEIHADAMINAAAWVPKMHLELGVSAVSRLANVVTVAFGGNAHGLTVGDTVELLDEYGVPADEALFPPGIKTITGVPAIDQLTYAEVGANGNNAGSMTYATTSEPVVFDQEAVAGSWAHSAFQEPDAWPPRFRYQVGGPNTTLQRITSQGEALLFWTSDGLYRLTGNDEDDFTVRPLDPTINLVGASTPATMGNKAFALTTQGVVSVTDLGVEKVSTPVDLALLPYYASTPGVRDITDLYAFGVAYQSENEYMLFLPDLEGLFEVDRAYVFNTQTGTWVKHTWTWTGINESTGAVTAAVVGGSDNYLYIASADWITRERKDRALTDYQDADNAGIPLDVAYNVETARNPGALKQWTEVACLLESPQPASVELYFTTEIDSTEAGGTITSKGNKAVRTYVPRNMSRSARLTVGLRHSTAQERPTILGLSVVYNTSSTRVGR